MKPYPYRYSCVLLLVASAFLTLALPCPADGIFIPPNAVEKLPDMPRQRGLILWRDGVEQLLVESTLDGEGEAMAWIVPVPNAPAALEVGTSGVFDTFEQALTPRTVHESGGFIALGVVFLIWCCCQLLINEYAPRRSFLCTLIVCVLFFGVIGLSRGMMQTAGGGSRGGGASMESVQVLQVEQVGQYEVTTLQATDAAGLLQWLEDNGFRSLPDGGEAIVREYVEEGWCFITAQLQRDGGGYARPHPLFITFPAEVPVYPMRLTRLAGTDLYLDLYVIADRRAKAPGMETIYCDRYRLENESGHRTAFGSAFRRNAFALPWLTGRMQEQDVLTHLRAEIPAAAMKKDIEVGFRGYAPQRKHLYLPAALKRIQTGYGLTCFGLLFGIGLFWRYWRAQQRKVRFGRSLAFLLALLVAWPVSQLPTVIYEQGVEGPARMVRFRDHSVQAAVEILTDHPEIMKSMDRDAIEAYLLESMAVADGPESTKQRYLGEGPGRFELLVDERGTVLRQYADSVRHDAVTGTPIECILLTPEGEISRHARASYFAWPDLDVTPELMLFGHVPVGQSKTLPILLINSGSVMADCSATIDPPFYIDEATVPKFLKPGTSAYIDIEFRPSRVGEFEVNYVFEHSYATDVNLTGNSFPGQAAEAGIRVNELTTWNTQGLANFDGEYPDWIELYNENDFAVDLEGWGLSDDKELPFKYTFPPNSVIGPLGFMVIYATDTMEPPSGGMNVGFELPHETGGFLGLSNPDGTLVSDMEYPPFDEPDWSYAFFPDEEGDDDDDEKDDEEEAAEALEKGDDDMIEEVAEEESDMEDHGRGSGRGETGKGRS